MTTDERAGAGSRAAAGPAGIQGRRAGFVTRAAANALDVALVVLLLFAGYLVVAALRFLWHPSSFRFPAPSLELVLTIGGLLLIGYFALAWTAVGRTYGDEVLGLRVVDRRGRRLGGALATARAALCVLFPLGLLWVLVSPRNRALQDVVLRTSVVYDWSRP